MRVVPIKVDECVGLGEPSLARGAIRVEIQQASLCAMQPRACPARGGAWEDAPLPRVGAAPMESPHGVD